MLTVQTSLLLIVDVQGRLVSLMPKPDALLKAVTSLIQGARTLKIPVFYTEQVPQKIGKTHFDVARLLKGQKPVEKITFSCMGEKKFVSALQSLQRKQIIIAGIESHVCVYQTVRDLLAAGFEVYTAVDAIAARNTIDHHTALERMKDLGAVPVTVEMVLCELLGKAEGPQFKEILKLMKQN